MTHKKSCFILGSYRGPKLIEASNLIIQFRYKCLILSYWYFKRGIVSERTCRKNWTFTRVPQFEFIGDANEEVNNVQTIAECRNLCLRVITPLFDPSHWLFNKERLKRIKIFIINWNTWALSWGQKQSWWKWRCSTSSSKKTNKSEKLFRMGYHEPKTY